MLPSLSPQPGNTNTVVAFDVDGTLIHDERAGEKCDTPRYEIIALFRTFEALGCKMVIWSGGGVDYAERWAQKLGLTAEIRVKGSFKPDIAFDDMDLDFRKTEGSLGAVNVQV